jgi:hypothetical protein
LVAASPENSSTASIDAQSVKRFFPYAGFAPANPHGFRFSLPSPRSPRFKYLNFYVLPCPEPESLGTCAARLYPLSARDGDNEARGVFRLVPEGLGTTFCGEKDFTLHLNAAGAAKETSAPEPGGD